MKIIDAANLDYRLLNEALRMTSSDCTIESCCGQRFIAAGMSGKNITINGMPGNALGAYLNNANITVKSNAQDAIGDTMNEGKILIHGNIGDAAGSVSYTHLTYLYRIPYKAAKEFHSPNHLQRNNSRTNLLLFSQIRKFLHCRLHNLSLIHI